MASDTSAQELPHVMISYQWDAQDRMLKLRDELTRSGFDVWMDVYQMEGNMDDRMAEAIEEASVVLICFSKKYQASDNCKKEAQYATGLKKLIVPLKYENYQPSGWLGLMINGLLYYDVQTNDSMMKNISRIIRALDKQGVSRGSIGEPKTVSTKCATLDASEPAQPVCQPAKGFTVIQREDVVLGEILGGGGFGTVYLAGHKHWGDVAVKKFKSRVSEEVRSEAENMWRAISSPYLVRIMGIIADPENLCIVMEYFENGNLKDFQKQFMQSSTCLARKIRMILDMSLGMNYLHTLKPPILHRDIKLSNIFVGNGFGAKIGDLGLAINKRPSSEVDASSGTCTHIPPEAWGMSEVKPTEPFDIYTFGITLYEFLSGQDPWPAFATASQISQWVQSGHRPDTGAIPSYTPTAIIDIMKLCWSSRHIDRPSFQEIQKRVSVLYNQTHKTNIRTADQTIISEMSKAEQVLSNMKSLASMKKGSASNLPPLPIPDRTAATHALSDSGIGISDISNTGGNSTQQVLNLMRKIREFGKEGDRPGDFARVRGIAISPANGDVIVADPTKKAVLVFTQEGQFKFLLTSPVGHPEGQLRTPHDVAVSSQGCLMVVDQTKFVKIFDEDGNYLQSFSTMKKYDPDKKVGTCCLTVDVEGQILVGNYHKKLITIHDALDGEIKDKLTVNVEPYFVATNSRHQIVIGDLKGRKVCVTDYSGHEVISINPLLEGAPCIPLGVACDAKDGIFVAVVKADESGKGTLDTGCILQYSTTGLFMACVARDLCYPMGMGFSQDGLLAVANHSSVVTFKADGN